ncbi:hypothetical protein LSUB1_G006024, partial [Lachnellula subtilissima]
MNLIDLIYQRFEIIRLENRYTRRRNRRSTFVSEAQYVDGEYVYSPNSAYSVKCSAGNSDDEDSGSKESSSKDSSSKGSSQSKASRRMSKMGLEKMDWRKGREGRDKSTVSVRE